MKGFQVAILAIFGVGGAIAILLFAGVIPGFKTPENGVAGKVYMWGVVSEQAMNPIIRSFNEANKDILTLEYLAIPEASFQTTLTESLAVGVGPDLIIFNDKDLFSVANKVFKIPYESYPERSFRDTFINGGDTVVTSSGVLALPLFVDPLVLYYNKSLFSSAGIANPPASWTDVLVYNEKIKQIDDAKNIKRAGIALGEFKNIFNAKDILTTLLLQAGNNIILRTSSGLISSFDGGEDDSRASVASVNFFNQFSDQNKSTYTWNSSMPDSRTAFSSGLLAMYIGHASEKDDIQNQNPHLDFDVAVLPQRNPNSGNSITSGKTSFVAVMGSTSNLAGAVQAAFEVSGYSFSKNLSLALNLPSARRDILAEVVLDPFLSVFYRSALIVKSWTDPAPLRTEEIFRDLSDRIRSGRLTPEEAIMRADDELKLIIGQQ